jgi:nitroreductase
MKIIDERRSVRSFSDQKVEEEKILNILKAAMQAPSAKNQQPWEFVVIENYSVLKQLVSVSNYEKFEKGASVAIVVLAKTKDLKSEKFFPQDLGASIENLLLEAVEQGLGATWLGVYPKEERVEALNDILDLKEDVIPFALIALGYPKKENQNKYIDRFDEKRIQWIK